MEFGPILRTMKRNPFRFGLIVTEIALTLAIVVNCVGLILHTREELVKESGFDDESLLFVRSLPFDKAFQDDNYLEQSIAEDLKLLRGLPGVAAATNTSMLPWQGGGSSSTLKPAGTEVEPLRTQTYNGDYQLIDTLDLKIISGRNFTPEELVIDPNATSFPIIISKAYADLVYPGQEAVGKALQGSRTDRSYPIVGVFDHFYNPYAWEIGNYATFFSSTVGSYSFGSPYLVRVKPGEMSNVSKAIEESMVALNKGRIVTIRAIPEVKEEYQTGQSLTVMSLNAVIGLLVFVTAVGIVGLTAFSVTERTRQIGTRRALGARRADILRYFLLENWIVTSIGVGLGMVGAYALNFALMSITEGVQLDWRILIAGVGILWLTGLGAALGPALRAMKIPPAIATRNV